VTRPVADRLGFKPGMRCLVQGAPDGFDAGLPADAAPPHDLMLVFVRDAAAVATVAPEAERLYRDGARLWFAYPKRSSAIRTDIHRDHGWAPVEGRGLLPVAQVALDETWSALRFRRRHEIARLTRRSAGGAAA
jgi:hypothetical protein